MYERNLEVGEAPGVSSCPGKKKCPLTWINSFLCRFTLSREGKRQGQGLKNLLEESEEGLGQKKEAEGCYYERYILCCRFSC